MEETRIFFVKLIPTFTYINIKNIKIIKREEKRKRLKFSIKVFNQCLVILNNY